MGTSTKSKDQYQVSLAKKRYKEAFLNLLDQARKYAELQSLLNRVNSITEHNQDDVTQSLQTKLNLLSCEPIDVGCTLLDNYGSNGIEADTLNNAVHDLRFDVAKHIATLTESIANLIICYSEVFGEDNLDSLPDSIVADGKSVPIDSVDGFFWLLGRKCLVDTEFYCSSLERARWHYYRYMLETSHFDHPLSPYILETSFLNYPNTADFCTWLSSQH